MPVDLDLARLEHWLGPRLPGHGGPLTAEKFPRGQSNPTYRLTAGDRQYVLRRQPFGELLPSAHAVDREYRLLVKLHPLGFPVPRPIALCEERSIIGATFYVMELVDGRTFWKGTLPDQQPQDRRAIYEDMISTVGRLHRVDFAAAGLSDFGRPGHSR
jgi:aminoglycoside phosphotransferase (APT) family kinase protein